LKNKQTISRKRSGVVAQGVGPELKTQYCKKKREENRKRLVGGEMSDGG
jgi:hypothetical protein